MSPPGLYHSHIHAPSFINYSPFSSFILTLLLYCLPAHGGQIIEIHILNSYLKPKSQCKTNL